MAVWSLVRSLLTPVNNQSHFNDRNDVFLWVLPWQFSWPKPSLAMDVATTIEGMRRAIEEQTFKTAAIQKVLMKSSL